MSAERLRFTVRATASRLEKGFIAIPQKFRNVFPHERCKISVAFDDEDKSRALTFHPYDPAGKENRIFGIRDWLLRRGVVEGDLISITVEDSGSRAYRIALNRYLQEKEEQESRRKLRAAATDSEAERQLGTLLRLTKKRPGRLAREELLRMAEFPAEKRARILSRAADRHEGIPPAIRVLLRELHGGKCQLCSFTFKKRNAEPYFEIHHLEPLVGHHPTNLLVVCANCHAQLEQATVTEFERAGVWPVAVTINGKRVAVRQPFTGDSAKLQIFLLIVSALFSYVGRILAK